MAIEYKRSNSRLARWGLRLQEYDFKVIHMPGKVHGNVDALSRLNCIVTQTLLDKDHGKELREKQMKDMDLGPIIIYMTSRLLLDDQGEATRVVAMAANMY